MNTGSADNGSGLFSGKKPAAGGGSFFSFFKPKDAPPPSPAAQPPANAQETEALKRRLEALEKRLAELESRPVAVPPEAQEEKGPHDSDLRVNGLKGDVAALAAAAERAADEGRVREGRVEGALAELKGKLAGLYRTMLVAAGGETGKIKGDAAMEEAAAEAAGAFSLRFRLFEKMYQEFDKFRSRSSDFVSRLGAAEKKLVELSSALGRLDGAVQALAAETSALSGLDAKLSPALDLAADVAKMNSGLISLSADMMEVSGKLRQLSEIGSSERRALRKDLDKLLDMEMRLQNITVVFNHLRTHLSRPGPDGAGA